MPPAPPPKSTKVQKVISELFDRPQLRTENIWENISRAVGTEPREEKSITGASGVEHQVLHIAVDDKRNRLFVVSADPDPRTAALMQVDIQATMPSTKVLIARPIVVDLGFVARKIIQRIGRPSFHVGELTLRLKALETLPKAKLNQFLDDFLGDLITPVKDAFNNTPLPVLTQIIAFTQQASVFDWIALLEGAHDQAKSNPLVSLDPLAQLDNMKADRDLGICSIPFYEFSGEDWELFNSGRDFDALINRMKSLGIYQYFFPSPDNAALALIDRGIHEPKTILNSVQSLPARGHPLSPPELVSPDTHLGDILDALSERGLTAEGDLGFDITPDGLTVRSSLKIRPREGTIIKLIRDLRRTPAINVGTISGNIGSIAAHDILSPINIGSLNVAEAANLASEVAKHIGELTRAGADGPRLKELVEELTKQSASSTPDKSQLRGLLQDLRNVVTGAAGSLTAEGIVRVIDRLVGAG